MIPGNHDLTLDHKFWSENCTEAGAHLHEDAMKLWKDEEKNGILLLTEPGIREFVLENGAKLRIYSSPFTPNHSGVREWPFGHAPSHDIYNPPGTGISYATRMGTEQTILSEKEIGRIDVMISHGPPKYRLDVSAQGESLGCRHLFRAIRRVKPRVVAFGHVHHSYGAEVVRWKEGIKMREDDDEEDGIENVTKVSGSEDEGIRMTGSIEGWTGNHETLFVNCALEKDGRLANASWLIEMELDAA